VADTEKQKNSTVIRISGSDALWGIAYKRYYRLWMNLARSSRLSEDDAKDVVHTVLTGILTDGTHEFESFEHLRNYVCRAVLNRVILYHQQQVRKTPLPDLPDPSAYDPLNSTTLSAFSGGKVIEELIRSLKKKHFEIIKYRFYSGLTFSEISLLMGKPISTLKSREEAAMRAIRKELRKRRIL
jgi:RNA polymerase sigma factor (sigma-70 family)